MDGDDPFRRLPQEMRLRILSYLDPADLVASSRVSRLWRAAVNDNELWKRFVPREEMSIPEAHGTLCKQRVSFHRHARSVRMWLDGDYWLWDFHHNRGTVLIANGAILLSWSPDCLYVYDLNAGSISWIQRIVITGTALEVEKARAVVSENGEYVALRTEHRYSLAYFGWSLGRLTFFGCLSLARDNGDRLRFAPNAEEDSLPYDLVHITAEGCAVLTNQFGEVCVSTVNLERPPVSVTWSDSLKSVYSHDGFIYFCGTGIITVFKGSSDVVRTLAFIGTYDWVKCEFSMEFNRRTILARLKTNNQYNYTAWKPNFDEICKPFKLTTWNSACNKLHPNLEALCYLELTLPNECRLVVLNLLSKAILWTVPVSPNIGLYHKSIFISERHLVFVASEFTRPSSRFNYHIVDLKHKLTIEHQLNLNSGFQLHALNKKLAIYKQSGENMPLKIVIFT